MCLPAVQNIFHQTDEKIAGAVSSLYKTFVDPLVKCVHEHIHIINTVALLAFSWMALTYSPHLFVIGTICGAIYALNGSQTLVTIYNIFNDSILNKDTAVLSFVTGIALVATAPPFMSLVTGWFVGQSFSVS